MPLTVHSSRFGRLEPSEQALIRFPYGLIGLPGARFALIGPDGDSPFMWLQSAEDPGLAVPVANPFRFFAGYAIELNSHDAARIALTDASETTAYVIVRSDSETGRLSANLRAPLLVSRGQGFQVINQRQEAPLRAPLPATARATPRAA